MKSIKSDFPIFANNPELIYLDSASTLQKPQQVIDAVSSYLSNDYANIHRGMYELSQKSEEIYESSRSTVAELIWANDDSEVIFTGNSTDSTNLLARSLLRSGRIQKGDNIILTELEHHANLLPRKMAAEQVGAELRRVEIGTDGILDPQQVIKLVDEKTKVVALSMCSNVTGVVWREEIRTITQTLPSPAFAGVTGETRMAPLIVVDASQAVAHFPLELSDLGCDFCFFTGHKLGALTGTGVLWWKKELLKSLKPGKVWWWAVSEVTKTDISYIWTPDSFEPGTPNVVWALSLREAIHYIQDIESWAKKWYDAITEIERPMIEHCLQGFKKLENEGKIELLWWYDENRIWVFSFIPKTTSITELAQKMSEANIALRTGTHCTHIYHAWLTKDSTQTCRISLWAYNEMSDVERFIWSLASIL